MLKSSEKRCMARVVLVCVFCLAADFRTEMREGVSQLRNQRIRRPRDPDLLLQFTSHGPQDHPMHLACTGGSPTIEQQLPSPETAVPAKKPTNS
jgi:hypothetical protein